MLIFKYLGLRLGTIVPVSSAFKMSLTFLVVILGRSFIYKKRKK